MIKKNDELISNFVALMSFKSSDEINNKFIIPKVDLFFKSIGISDYKCIYDNSRHISYLDFKSVDFFYFYDNILNDIRKSGDTVINTIKYCITFDRECCKKVCDITGTFYDVIALHKKPIMYFIYIDINEIFNFIKNNPTK